MAKVLALVLSTIESLGQKGLGVAWVVGDVCSLGIDPRGVPNAHGEGCDIFVFWLAPPRVLGK